MSNDSPSTEGHQHCVQQIFQHSQCVQRHHNFSRCVCFRHRGCLSFHGPRQDISRPRVYAHDEVFRTSCPRYEITFRILEWRTLAKTSRVHQGRIGSCWIRRGYHCRTHRLVKGPWQLRQGLDESSGHSAAKRVIRDPFPRSPSLKVTAVPSDSSLELTSLARENDPRQLPLRP